MNKKLLLVDFENVQQVDLSRLDDNFQIIILVGANQKSIPIELVTNAQKLGTRVEWQKVDGTALTHLTSLLPANLDVWLKNRLKLIVLFYQKTRVRPFVKVFK